MFCAAKYNNVFNNEQQAEERFKQMYKEFSLGCTIDNDYIIKTYYFVRKWETKKKSDSQDFLLLLEKMDGGNLNDYLQK